MATATRCVPKALLDGVGAERLIDCVRALPDAAGDQVFLLEFRLGEPAPAADLSLWAVPHTPFADFLVARGEADGASPAQRGLAHYLKDVGRPEGFLAQWLAYAMLEYDLADTREGELPTPGVFLGSRFDNPAARAANDAVRWRHGNPGVMIAAVCRAVGWREDCRERRQVQRACDLLPQSGYSAQVGAMPEREPRAIRLVTRLPAVTVPDYLARAAWPGSIAKVAALLEEAAAFELKVSLAIDVGAEGLLPRIGFELFLDNRWKAPPQRWHEYLKRLASHGLCLPEKEQALRHWPRRELLFQADGTRRLLSGINHVKLVVADGSIAAKAYPMMKLVPGQ